MKKVMVVGCGAYMDSGYGCAGEWRCLKAAALGEGEFDEPSQVISFVTCECPGRSLAAKVNAKPDCPYSSAEQFAQILESKFQIPVVLGTHEYH
jgi:predicted metal-binding protein